MRPASFVWLVVLLSAACTQDFSVFGFDHGTKHNPGKKPDAGAARPAEPSDSGPRQPPLDSGDDPPVVPQPEAGSGEPQQPTAMAGHSAPPPDASDQPITPPDPSDAGTDDAGMSEPARTPECRANWSQLDLELPDASDIVSIPDASDLPPTPAVQCENCACAACAVRVLDCLQQGTPAERGLCRDMLTCALRNGCQEYECYCATSGCGLPNAIGDGPCAEEINAAAGGGRNRVFALLSAEPPNANHPLVRAAEAIGCIYGV